jgi:Beta-ketoacyl synthase, N-terminal domain
MNPLTGFVHSIGVLGPGLADWAGTRAMLRGEPSHVAARTVLPPPAVLPPAERRRAGRVIKLALAVGAEAAAGAAAAGTPVDARALPTVFTSSGGDGDNCHEICVALASRDRQISPTRFHNSVHNAAAGYWSIAYGCTEASTSLCAGDASFGAGLLEALSQLACSERPVLLLAYDADYPQPLHASRPIPDAFGVALLLVPAGTAAGLARVQLTLTDAPAATMDSAVLESMRGSIPAARSLPLLERLAQQRDGTVILDYLDSARLALEVKS